MKHSASPEFWEHYHKLPPAIQDLADKNFDLLKKDLHHPSLHLKKVGRFWSVRVGIKHRAIAVQVEETLIWFWIGNHAEYSKLLQQKA